MSDNENSRTPNHQVPVETYKCSQCNFYTNHEYYLQQHSLTHSLQNLVEQYKRNQSNYDTDNQIQSYLRPHNISHSIQMPVKYFQCLQCNFETNQETYYKEHILIHETQPSINGYRISTQRNFDEEQESYIKPNISNVLSIDNFSSNYVKQEQRNVKPHNLTQSTQVFENCFLKQPDLDTEPLENFRCLNSNSNCTSETQEEFDFKQHSLSDDLQIPCPEVFKCTKCLYKSLHEEDLKQHIKQHQEEIILEEKKLTIEVFKCHNCNYSTNLKAFLERHMSSHTRPSAQIKATKHKCSICNFVTEHVKFLKRHLLSHKESKSYKCKMCSFETLYRKMYLKHIATKHKLIKKVSAKKRKYDIITVKCMECNFETETKEQLEIHKKLRHRDKSDDSNLHICQFCEYQTNWEPCLKRHIERLHPSKVAEPAKRAKAKDKSTKAKKGNRKNSSGKEMLRCNNCDFTSTSKQYLILHLKRSHICKEPESKATAASKIYRCKQKNCLFVSTVKYTFIQHVKNHRRQKTISNLCDLCDFISESADKLAAHKKKVHLTYLLKVYKCSQCDFKTVCRNSFKAHSVKHKSYFCNICNEQLVSAYAMVKHRRSHKIQKQKNIIYLCDVCGFQSKNDRSLKMHKKTHNPEFKCPDCPFETHSKINFQNHCINHKSADEVTMFPCPYCSYQSRLKRNLAWHMKRHADPTKAKIFKCPSCDYQTFTNAQLKSHLMVHKSKEEVVMLKCDFCPFETKRKSNIVQHRLRHLKDSPDVPLLSCPDCNYTTVAKRHLNKHRKTHNVNPDKMFQCSYCPFKIHRKVYLMRHMENHKNVDPVESPWERYPYAPQGNVGVTIVPNLGQNMSHSF
ncbi:zinc finger protein 845-like [Sitophilus oryzae]|uniref:Zinc finger protein 845-like n=1 Tax=Sitophilus oryzae TaxID=7048 RepID=A0A6J2YXT9_SITOR|nr:zinc finger protein 845-like [Sitophilus oryzae]